MDEIHLVTAPYFASLVAFTNNYGLMVLGAMILLASFSGRRFGPLALLPLVFGLGLVLSGAAHLLVPLWGKL